MAENKLTDAKLRALLGKPVDKQLTIADGLGLSIRVSKAGGLSWLYRFRTPIENKSVWLTLGRYPDLSIKQARRNRDQCREWLVNGLDPRVERRTEKEETFRPITVKGALTVWLQLYASEKRENAEKHRSQFSVWIYPKIGNLAASQVTINQWLSCFDERASKHPVAAGYVLRNVQQAMRFCKKRGLDINPSIFELDFEAIGAKRQAKRNRRLIEDGNWKEFHELITWLGTAKIPEYYKNLLTLLIVFGARTVEVRESKVNEWDLERLIWTVPAAHNKTGARDIERGRSGEIKRPIPPEIAPYLKSLCEESNTDYILGQKKNSEAVSVWGGKVWQKVGHKDKWTLHDLRRTVATGMNDIGVAPHVVESILGHSIQGVAGIYNHSQYLPEKEQALNLWLGKIRQLEAGENVVFLKQRA